MKNNPRITSKERGLIKGALRRVFSRSDLRRAVLERGVIQHIDETRPKVKTWVFCESCGILDAKSNFQIDHINPVVPINIPLTEMTADELINNMWCEINNLQRVCIPCHKAKSKEENALRRKLKKEKTK